MDRHALGGGSTVARALLELQRLDRGPRALVGEGPPAAAAAARWRPALGQAGVPTWLVVDGGAAHAAVADRRRSGSGPTRSPTAAPSSPSGGFAVALAAREHSVPVHVLATRRKFLPATTGGAAHRGARRPRRCGTRPPAGVRPRNVHAELVPLELLRGVVVEDGVLGPTEAATVARERPLPEPLAGGARPLSRAPGGRARRRRDGFHPDTAWEYDVRGSWQTAACPRRTGNPCPPLS